MVGSLELLTICYTFLKDNPAKIVAESMLRVIDTLLGYIADEQFITRVIMV